ncbi:MAG: cytochrome c oxidase assembly factor Coa1 family protein [Verrucomicrobiota bacterium]|jgi:hypothetical protein
MPTPPPLTGVRPKQDWWSRNWKWFVPVLALAALLVLGVFLFSLLSFLRSTDAYAGAVARVKESPLVIEAIGSPIHEGWFFSGHINFSGSSGNADFAIPIKGPKGKATIYVVANRTAGQWRYDRLIVQLAENSRRLDLSEK